jgi:hypothetical protein
MVLFPMRARDIFLLSNKSTLVPEPIQPFALMGYPGSSGLGVKVTTYLLLVSELRMSGALPPPHAFKVCIMTTLFTIPFYSTLQK